MCPDIETYAPYISATFGLADTGQPPAHPGHSLRVRLADRSLRQTNPLFSTVAELLELADARVTASQLLDLAAVEPVRRRFRFDDDDLDRVRDWVGQAGVRWGIDAAHRTPFSMQGVTQNTWQAGLDRVLLGVTMSEDDLRWLGLALPLDDVDSNDVDLAGRFSEFVDRFAAVLEAMSGVHPLAGWLATLGTALDTLTAVSPQESWQLAQAHREFDAIAAAAGPRAERVTLSLADVRALLDDRLKGRPTRAGFRTGDLTMCSMVPMRSVPHRVICLLGLDDGVFPRTAGVDGDDILARDPCVGERDPRSEDRQLFLDAILAAEEYLVILYTGADERTNTVRPPAVPVGELLDVVDASVRTAGESSAREQVVVRHPLQPFDARNFTSGQLGKSGPFSFDRSALAGAQAAVQPRSDQRPFLAHALPPADQTGAVELQSLIGFLEHPVKQFLRQRLGAAVLEEDDELDDALHAELGPLDRWAVGDRWVQSRLGGADVDACQQAEWRRGTLPPGQLGVRLLEEVVEQAEPLLAASEAERAGAPSSFDITVPLPGGRRLTGTVTGVYGTTLSRTVFSKLSPKHRLRAWVQLLALAAAQPDQPWRAVTAGLHRRPGVATSEVSAPPASLAVAILAAYVDLRDRGLCEPLPVPVTAGAAYAAVRHIGDSEQAALDASEKAWTSSFEDRDRHHAFVWGANPRFAGLLASRATPADEREGGANEERTRFGALACRIWWPLLDAETLETP
jgi:exodeoxyribonuclease V gamma subunit